MKRLCIGLMLAASASLPAAGQELRIGYLNTTSGPGAVIGRHMEAGWRLGLEHQGWKKDGDKLGGVPTRVFFADDQGKPDVALKEVDRFLKQDKVHVVSGVIWSHVMLAIQKPVLEANVLLFSGNAGPTQLAGELCNPLFVSASFVNDQVAEAMGEMATRDRLKTVFAMAPNYQAGKDVVAGFERTFTGGKIVDRALYKVNESDFQADFSKVRATKPEAVFVFAPGAMGTAFMKQWRSSGLGSQTKLYAMWTISHLNLPAIGEAALGAVMVDHWNPGLAQPRNERFIKDYIARWGEHPSIFAVTSYDVAAPLARGVRAVQGEVENAARLARTIRTGPFESVRGDLKFNVNGFPIQPFWKLEIVKGDDGKPLIKGIDQILARPDRHAEKCPASSRI
jgi:branched-chain amino acid transport system substrate-binding protein